MTLKREDDRVTMMLRQRRYLVEAEEPLTLRKVQQFRKEFLVLMSNIKKLKDYDQVEYWRKAVIRWSELFEELMGQAKADIKGRLIAQIYKSEGEKKVNEKEANYLLDHMKPIWNFEFEFRSVPGVSFSFVQKYEPWQTKEDLFCSFKDDVKKWESRVRNKARRAWKWLDDFVKWTMQSGLYGGGGDPVTLNTREISNIDMYGFSVQVLGITGREFEKELLHNFKRGIKIFKTRASKMFPQMIRRKMPIVLNFDSGRESFAGRYYDDRIELSVWGMSKRDPRKVAQIIAHEIGHRIWRKLSNVATKEWRHFIHGLEVRIDLRDVLKKAGSKGNLVFDKKLAREDPILFLQIGGLAWDSRYGLETLDDIKKYLDKGNDPIVRVSSKPITAYASKNPEESFCEALGMLVAYGPRTVLPKVRSFLKRMLPRLRIENRADEICKLKNLLVEGK